MVAIKNNNWRTPINSSEYNNRKIFYKNSAFPSFAKKKSRRTLSPRSFNAVVKQHSTISAKQFSNRLLKHYLELWWCSYNRTLKVFCRNKVFMKYYVDHMDQYYLQKFSTLKSKATRIIFSMSIPSLILYKIFLRVQTMPLKGTYNFENYPIQWTILLAQKPPIKHNDCIFIPPPFH